MKGWQVQYIHDNLTSLMKNIKCSPLFCAELFSKKAITEDDYDELVSNNKHT